MIPLSMGWLGAYNGNTIILRENGNIDDPVAAVATLEKWLEKQKKAPAFQYYSSVVREYKQNRPKEAEVEKLYRAARPEPFVIEITR